MSNTALEKSIAKWRANAVSHPADVVTGVDHCPLCAVYYSDKGCTGCPVRERTGYSFCQFTPYSWAASLCRAGSVDEYSERDVLEFQQAAREEVAFLESLRDCNDVA